MDAEQARQQAIVAVRCIACSLDSACPEQSPLKDNLEAFVALSIMGYERSINQAFKPLLVALEESCEAKGGPR